MEGQDEPCLLGPLWTQVFAGLSSCSRPSSTMAHRSVAPPRALAQGDTVKAELVLVEQPLSSDWLPGMLALRSQITELASGYTALLLPCRSLHGFVPVTPEAEAPRCAKAASRCFSLRCDRHKVLTWEWMGASCYLRLGAALKRPV
ncbi:unnamed protein product [Pleuronectes platessa]|uniref:Uncharacterized protein n=1 Tax=Pleuronectes platessa TaxID=8262 RepID=A0A9N7W3B1_PLEPL|nr:unnamed protein product [Pleuronectes platessa]